MFDDDDDDDDDDERLKVIYHRHIASVLLKKYASIVLTAYAYLLRECKSVTLVNGSIYRNMLCAIPYHGCSILGLNFEISK